MDFVWDHPLSAREILGSALRLTREHGGVFVRLALGPLLIAMAVDFASRALPAESLAIVPVLLIVAALYVYAETRVAVAAWELLHNHAVDPTMVITQVRRRWTTIVLTYVLKSILVLLGLLLFVVPGVLLMLRWFAVPLTNAVEGLRVRAGFRRSRTLARGNRRQIFATIAIIDLTVGAVVIGCTIAAMDFTTGQAPVWVSILLWLFSFLYLPFHAALSAVLYANARIRNEGYPG